MCDTVVVDVNRVSHDFTKDYIQLTGSSRTMYLVVADPNTLYLGNAGTASRFLTTVATLAKPPGVDSSILTGRYFKPAVVWSTSSHLYVVTGTSTLSQVD